MPFVEDLGSGALVDTQTVAGIEHEPTPPRCIGRGVDLVCFSGDKLLGGPQAGIIAGRQQLVAALKREPLFRALRCDKLILSALEATVDHYLRGERERSCPGDAAPRERRSARAAPSGSSPRSTGCRLVARSGRRPGADRRRYAAALGDASVTLDLTHRTLKPQELAARLRRSADPGDRLCRARHAQARSADDFSAAGRGRHAARSAPSRR